MFDSNRSEFGSIVQKYVDHAAAKASVEDDLNKRIVKITPIWYKYNTAGLDFNIYGLDDGFWYFESLFGLSKFNSKHELFTYLGLSE